MKYFNEIDNMTLTRFVGRLPINEDSKMKGSAIVLLTPTIESSINMINSNLIDNKYHNGYYIERAIMYYVNLENNVIGSYGDEVILEDNKLHIVNESGFTDRDKISIKPSLNDFYKETDHGFYINNGNRIDMLLFDDNEDEIESIQEASLGHTETLRKIYATERLKRRRDVFKIHDEIKSSCPSIRKTQLSYKRFRKDNIFTDFYYYNEVFFKNNYFTNDKGVYLYMDIVGRYLSDKRLAKSGYNMKTVFIPIEDWIQFTGNKNGIHKHMETINPISVIYSLLSKNDSEIKKRWGTSDIVIFGKDSYFKFNLSEMDNKDASRFLALVKQVSSGIKEEADEKPLPKIEKLNQEEKESIEKIEDIIEDITKDLPDMDDYNLDEFILPDDSEFDKDDDEINKLTEDIIDKIKEDDINKQRYEAEVESILKDADNEGVSAMVLLDEIINDIELGAKVTINNLTGNSSNQTMDDVVNRVKEASYSSNNIEDVYDVLDMDDEFKDLIKLIKEDSDFTTIISPARIERQQKLKDGLLDVEIDDRTVREILDDVEADAVLEAMDIDIDSINNEEWGSVKFPSFEEVYNVEDDIIDIMNDLSSDDKKYPIGIRDIKVEDTSDTENYKKTYTFFLEDSKGKRNQLKLDVPEFVDNKYLMLGGSKKTITRQLILLPIVKTNVDTVQIVTNYKKLFITRFGSRIFVISDRIKKFLKKVDSNKNISVKEGNSTLSNSKYNLPIDYVDLGESINKIETKDFIFYFDQDEVRKNYDIKEKDIVGFPIGYNKLNKSVIYCTDNFSAFLLEAIFTQDTTFRDIYNTTKESTSYSYSRVIMLNNNIPLILILSYVDGLVNVLEKAKIKYTIHKTRPKRDPDKQGLIRFKDTYLMYDITFESSLLLNGLTACNTEDYDFIEVSRKNMYLDFLDKFGGRILADGIENFNELLIDPITRSILKDKGQPTDFVRLLLYGNNLLADTGFAKHTDLYNMRLRSNEIIAACVYRVISTSYGQYRTELNRRGSATMTAKQSAVIDEILKLNNVNEASELTPFLEVEELTAVSTKGPSGLNTERAYGLDKRAYDETMRNVIALSTPQGKGIGINRQLTIDPNVDGKRGYIKPGSKDDEMSVTKSLNMSEALTSYGALKDDSPRTSMNLSQSKHTMRVKHADPLLISNGADQALPYMLSNTFAYKSKEDGKIIELTQEYMIVEYKSGKKEYVNLRVEAKKNSNSGFYVPVQLTTDKKLNQRVKKNEIIAYDPIVYGKSSGAYKGVSALPGTLTRVAIVQADDGFEDSVIISQEVSDKMTSEVVEKIEVIVDKDSNVYNVVSKGQRVREGDPLIVIQNASSDEDIGLLLRNLTGDKEDIRMIGRVPILSKHTGIIQEIRTVVTVDKSELSPSLRKEVNKTQSEMDKTRKLLEEYDIENINRIVDKTNRKEPTGQYKNVRDAVKFEIFIKYEDKMAVGDKLTFFGPVKGIVRDIFPEGKEPYTDDGNPDKIGAILAVASLNARMVNSVPSSTMINGLMIGTARKCKDILGIKY